MENILTVPDSAKTAFINYCDYAINYSNRNITEGNLGHYRGNLAMSLKSLKTVSSELLGEVGQEVLCRVQKILDYSIIFVQSLDTQNLRKQLREINNNIQYIISLLAS